MAVQGCNGFVNLLRIVNRHKLKIMGAITAGALGAMVMDPTLLGRGLAMQRADSIKRLISWVWWFGAPSKD